MDFFGLTKIGVASPIKETLRPDYEEPKSKPDLIHVLEEAKAENKPFSEVIKELDVYIGFVDGYSYGSYDRLMKMRNKGVMKPVGPTDMHKMPATDSMKYGWWYNTDCKLPPFQQKSWYKNERFPIVMSDMTKFAAKPRF